MVPLTPPTRGVSLAFSHILVKALLGPWLALVLVLILVLVQDLWLPLIFK